jgi:hypothetical protein
MQYRRTQLGTVILATCVAVALVGTAITSRTHPAATIPMLVALVVIAIFFHSLTVEIDGNELCRYFGPGLWTYRLTSEEIESVRAVRNRWWFGYRIRRHNSFILYNVSGLDAVELKLKTGNIRRIGTDDPHGLLAALQQVMRG